MLVNWNSDLSAKYEGTNIFFPFRAMFETTIHQNKLILKRSIFATSIAKQKKLVFVEEEVLNLLTCDFFKFTFLPI